jgi:competence protein ComEC
VGDEVVIEGIVWDEPRRSQYSQRFDLKNIVISVPEYPEYSFGDTVLVKGVVEINEFTTEKGEIIQEKIVKNPDISVHPSSFILKSVTYTLNTIVTIIKKYLPASEAALLAGITLGIRSEFSKPLLDAFTATGILHVVAASGSNVALLTSVVLFSLNTLITRKLAIVFTIVVVGWYALLSGFDPPIVRASIMALFVLIAQMFGRQSYSWFILCITVWIMLLIDPLLITNVGFQLSVGATVGIISIKPLLDRIFLKSFILKDDFSTTIAAQLATLPILFGVFGSFSPLSILVNLLVLWTVPIIMILGLFSSIGALLHESLAIPFLYSAYPFLVYFLTVIEITRPYVLPLSLSDFNIYLTISYYAFIASLYIFFNKRRYEKS